MRSWTTVPSPVSIADPVGPENRVPIRLAEWADGRPLLMKHDGHLARTWIRSIPLQRPQATATDDRSRDLGNSFQRSRPPWACNTKSRSSVMFTLLSRDFVSLFCEPTCLLTRATIPCQAQGSNCRIAQRACLASHVGGSVVTFRIPFCRFDWTGRCSGPPRACETAAWPACGVQRPQINNVAGKNRSRVQSIATRNLRSKAGQFHQVDGSKEPPGDEAGKLETENLRHRTAPAKPARTPRDLNLNGSASRPSRTAAMF